MDVKPGGTSPNHAGRRFPSPSPIQWVTEILSLGEQRPRREADHSPPFSTEVNNKWRFPSAPPYAFSVCTLIALRLLDVLQMFDSLTNK
jgi:hypothetical protein